MESAQSTRPCCRKRGRRQGIALVNALIFALLSAAFLIVAIQFTTMAIKQGRPNQSSEQVYNVALAGLNAATAWLRQQTTQPVTVFDPRGNQSEPDLDAETMSAYEQIGLVNEFVVDPVRDIKGRYEVGRSTTDGNPAPARDSLQAGSHFTGYTDPIPWTAEDISSERGSNTPGSVWLVRSKGYLFDGHHPFSLSSPKPMAELELQAEVYRRGFNFYPSAAYCFEQDNGSTLAQSSPLDWFQKLAAFWVPPAYATSYRFTLDNYNSLPAHTIIGVKTGSTARAYWSNFQLNKYYFDSGHTTVQDGPLADEPGCSTAGSQFYVNPSRSAQLEYIFGTSDLTAIQGMADYVYGSQSAIPNPMPNNAFIYVNGDCNFDSNNNDPTLSGGGVLFINGHCHIDGNNQNQTYRGVIICMNSYTQQHSSSVTGAVITGGDFKLKGGYQQDASLYYDQSVIDQVNMQVGTYQLNRATIKTPASTSPAASATY